MKVRSLLLFISIPCLLLPVMSCSAPDHAPDERYFLVASNIKVAYWQAVKNGFMKLASQYRVKAEVVGPDTVRPASRTF